MKIENFYKMPRFKYRKLKKKTRNEMVEFIFEIVIQTIAIILLSFLLVFLKAQLYFWNLRRILRGMHNYRNKNRRNRRKD